MNHERVSYDKYFTDETRNDNIQRCYKIEVNWIKNVDKKSYVQNVVVITLFGFSFIAIMISLRVRRFRSGCFQRRDCMTKDYWGVVGVGGQKREWRKYLGQ